MTGQHIRKPTRLTTTHRIGLTGNRKRAATRCANSTGSEMAVNDCINLVSATSRLINTLAVHRNNTFVSGKQLVKPGYIRGIEPCVARYRCDIQRVNVSQYRVKSGGVSIYKIRVGNTVFDQPLEQSAKQRGITIGPDG